MAQVGGGADVIGVDARRVEHLAVMCHFVVCRADESTQRGVLPGDQLIGAPPLRALEKIELLHHALTIYTITQRQDDVAHDLAVEAFGELHGREKPFHDGEANAGLSYLFGLGFGKPYPRR